MAVGYGDYLRGKVSSLVASCRRRVSSTARLLLRRQHRRRTTTTNNKAAGVAALLSPARGGGIEKPHKQGGEAAPVVALWSRRILMGERCQPLDFAGAIHYDSFGRRLARPPTPRSASSLSCRSSSSDDASCYYLPHDNDD